MNQQIDLSFLLPVDAEAPVRTPNDLPELEDYMEVGEDLAANCQRAAELVYAVLPDSQSADNLSDYDSGYDWAAYRDDMIDLAIELKQHDVDVIWADGKEPCYE